MSLYKRLDGVLDARDELGLESCSTDPQHVVFENGKIFLRPELEELQFVKVSHERGFKTGYDVRLLESLGDISEKEDLGMEVTALVRIPYSTGSFFNRKEHAADIRITTDGSEYTISVEKRDKYDHSGYTSALMYIKEEDGFHLMRDLPFIAQAFEEAMAVRSEKLELWKRAHVNGSCDKQERVFETDNSEAVIIMDYQGINLESFSTKPEALGEKGMARFTEVVQSYLDKRGHLEHVGVSLVSDEQKSREVLSVDGQAGDIDPFRLEAKYGFSRKGRKGSLDIEMKSHTFTEKALSTEEEPQIKIKPLFEEELEILDTAFATITGSKKLADELN